MFEAAREGTPAILLAAVDAGLPVNLTNDKGTMNNPVVQENAHLCLDGRPLGNTLLMLAAYAGHTELTRELLQRGADPNRLNDMGQSMIAGAVFKGHDEIVRVLVEKGADPRIGTPNAIQTAHMFGRTELMNVLGTRKEDINKEVPDPLSKA